MGKLGQYNNVLVFCFLTFMLFMIFFISQDKWLKYLEDPPTHSRPFADPSV